MIHKPLPNGLVKGGTLCFKGDARIYRIDGNQTTQCEKNCQFPHESDCFDGEYIPVKQENWLWKKVSEIDLVFDPFTHVGEKFRG